MVRVPFSEGPVSSSSFSVEPAATVPCAAEAVVATHAPAFPKNESSSSSSKRRYRCLIVDHDDTAVDSTAEVHHPAHCASVRELLPEGEEPIDLQGWFRVNHDPGVGPYLKKVFAGVDNAHAREMEIWHQFMEERRPQFFPHFWETLRDFKQADPENHFVCVVSQCPRRFILEHYAQKAREWEENNATSSPGGDKNAEVMFFPDLVFGGETEKSLAKPSPWCCEEIQRRLGVTPEECLVLDDLTPGIRMGIRAKCDTALAAWRHSDLIEAITAVAKDEGEPRLRVFRSVREFHDHVLPPLEKGLTAS